MSENNENWLEVSEESGIEVEDILRFDHNNKTYCIYKLEDGFFATDGFCTHEDVHLEDGLVIDDEIECPMHQGTFNVKTGKAISPPACEDLKTYPVKVEGDRIFVRIK